MEGAILLHIFLHKEEISNYREGSNLTDLIVVTRIGIKINRGFPGGSMVKNLPAMQETWVQSVVREDPTCSGAIKPVNLNY